MQLGELFMSRPLQWIYLGRWHRRGWRPRWGVTGLKANSRRRCLAMELFPGCSVFSD